MTELLLALAAGVPIWLGAGIASHMESRKHAANLGSYRARAHRRIHRGPGNLGSRDHSGGEPPL